MHKGHDNSPFSCYNKTSKTGLEGEGWKAVCGIRFYWYMDWAPGTENTFAIGEGFPPGWKRREPGSITEIRTATGSIESNGAALRDRAIRILEETGVEKLHVLAHSKGGLDARCMASLPGMAPRIASLTTVCTPHNGSVTVDRLLRLPDGLVRLVSFFCNLWFRILGDKQPDSYRVFHQLTTSEAAAFNASHPIPSGVRCRSYAFAMSRACSDLILCPIRWSKLWREKTTGWVTPGLRPLGGVSGPDS